MTTLNHYTDYLDIYKKISFINTNNLDHTIFKNFNNKKCKNAYQEIIKLEEEDYRKLYYKSKIQLEELNKKNKKADELIKSFQDNIKDLKSKLQIAQDRIEELESSDLNKQIEKLEDELLHLQSLRKENEKLSVEVRDLKEEKELLNAKVEDLGNNLTHLTEENEQKSAEYQTQQRKVNELYETVKKLRSQNTLFQDEKENLQKSLRTNGKRYKTLSDKYKELENNSKHSIELKKQYNELGISDVKTAELYIEYKDKFKDIAQYLSIDTTDNSWHRKVKNPIKDLKTSKENLDADILEYKKLLRQLNIEDFYDERAVDNIKIIIGTIESLKTKYSIASEDEIITTIDDLIKDGDKNVSKILEQKENTINKYRNELRESEAIIDRYKTEVIEALKIKDLRSSSKIITQYQEYSNFLGIQEFQDTLYSYQKYILLRDNPKYKQIFININDIVSEKSMPSFMKNLLIYLKILQVDLNEFYQKIKSDTDFKTLRLSDKLKSLENTIQELSDVDYLHANLAPNLHELSKTILYNEFVEPKLAFIFDSISTIYAYSHIPEPENLEIAKVFYQRKNLKLELDKIYHELQRYLSFEYDIQLRNINIFTEIFDSKLHEMIEFSDIQKLPNFKQRIEKLNHGIIYDIYSIGMYSAQLNLDIKPKVIYKQ